VSAAPGSERRARMAAGYWAWLLNIALGSLIGQRWLAHAADSPDLWTALFMQAALVSTMAMLAAIAFLPQLALAAWLRAPRALAWTAAILWTLFLVLVFADTVIYGMFRYHFNGLVWHELTTPGSEDAIHLDATLWLQVGAGALAVGVFEAWAWNGFHRRALRGAPSARRWFVRPAWIAGLLLFAIILGEKGAYAVADMTRDRGVMARGRLLPLYQPLTVKDMLGKRLGFDLSARPRVKFAEEGVLIRYPIVRPRLDPQAARPNVLILVIDSLRKDMLVPEVMPNLARWAQGGRRFEQHVSGGNATRFGIFSLVYGLHGSYWAPILNEQAPPVLVSTLVEGGYEPLVLSSASMNSPEFRSTCWVSIEDAVFDELEGSEKYERDRRLAQQFNAWIGARDAAQPFFAFALLDSPHQTYSVDPALTPFEPYIERVDYLAMSGEPTPETIVKVKHRYMNACATADVAAGAMLDELERLGLAQNTIVVVTGDHGEEFYENGHFGHTSNFTPEQSSVGFVMRGPGITPGSELRPTCHVDLVPTLLEQLGVDPKLRPEYSVGVNLLAPPEHRLRVISGWQEMGLWVEGGILYIPMEGHKGLVEAYDYTWKPLAEDRDVIQGAKSSLAQLSEECRRFLR